MRIVGRHACGLTPPTQHLAVGRRSSSKPRQLPTFRLVWSAARAPRMQATMQLGATPTCRPTSTRRAIAQSLRTRSPLLHQCPLTHSAVMPLSPQLRPTTVCKAADGPAPVSESQPQQLVGEDAAAFDVNKQSLQSWGLFFTLLTTVLGALYLVRPGGLVSRSLRSPGWQGRAPSVQQWPGCAEAQRAMCALDKRLGKLTCSMHARRCPPAGTPYCWACGTDAGRHCRSALWTARRARAPTSSDSDHVHA